MGGSSRAAAIGLVVCLFGCGSAGKGHDAATSFDGRDDAPDAPDAAEASADATDAATPEAPHDAADADLDATTNDAAVDVDAPVAVDAPDAAVDAPDVVGAPPDAVDAPDVGDEGAADEGDGGRRALNVTSAPTQLIHFMNGHLAGLDPRAPRMLGKLVVVSLAPGQGTYLPYVGKRGFHMLAASPFGCEGVPDWTRDPRLPGDCRANSFDGLPHGDQSSVTAASSLATQVKTTLAMLQTAFPTDDWAYFLDPDGSVRWSDVVLTGFDTGATWAARIGALVAVDRVVLESGALDNACGTGAAPSWPAGGGVAATGYYDAGCARFAAWLGDTPATPLAQVFALVGRQDPAFGNVMFAVDHLHVPGPPRDIDVTSPPYDGSHTFVHEAGRTSVVATSPTTLDRTAALDLAFDVPFVNRSPQF